MPETVVRLGRFDFLNILPVYRGLASREVAGPYRWRLVTRRAPASLNRLLAAGELEIAPVSSIELANRPGAYLTVPGLAIGSDGPGGSVVLFSRLPVEELGGRAVGLTPTSATSVALLQILFRRLWRVAPRVCRGPAVAGPGGLPEGLDGMLLIGDEAIRARVRFPDLHQADLGEAWRAMTGLPMIFAVWAMRREWAAREPHACAWASGELVQALEAGLSGLEAELPAHAARAGLPVDVLARYFFEQMDYRWGERQERGLKAFLDLCRLEGLTTAGAPGEGVALGG